MLNFVEGCLKKDGMVAYFERTDGEKIRSGKSLKFEVDYRKDDKTYRMYFSPVEIENHGRYNSERCMIHEYTVAIINRVARKSNKGLREAFENIRKYDVKNICTERYGLTEEDSLALYEKVKEIADGLK